MYFSISSYVSRLSQSHFVSVSCAFKLMQLTCGKSNIDHDFFSLKKGAEKQILDV